MIDILEKKYSFFFLWKGIFCGRKIIFLYDFVLNGSFIEVNKIFDCCNFGNFYVFINIFFFI